MSVRSEKIASVIKRALAATVSKLAIENKIGLASISTVKLSKDLSLANIYITIFCQNPEQTENKINKFLKILDEKNGMIRSIVAKDVRMRFTPEVRFFYDDTLDQIENIENLINKVKIKAPYKENYGDESVYYEEKLQISNKN